MLFKGLLYLVITGCLGLEFAELTEKDYQETIVEGGQEWGWTINYAFAVKPTNSERGEFVNARFTGNYVAEEWYQIKNGKLVSWNQTKRTNLLKIKYFIYIKLV